MGSGGSVPNKPLTKRSPRFQWVECKVRHVRRFRQNGPSFGMGEKHGLPKTRFVPSRQSLSVLSHYLNCEMKSPHLVDFS